MKSIQIITCITLIALSTACGSSKTSLPANTTNNSNSATTPESPELALEDDPNGNGSNIAEQDPADNAQSSQNSKPADITTGLIPTSNAGKIQSRLVAIAEGSLLQFNQAINQGQALDIQQTLCLNGFNPALGEPILTIDCTSRVSDAPVFTRKATFDDSEECRSDLMNNSINHCHIIEAEIIVDTLWSTPETFQSQPQRPKPKAGGIISYNIQQDRLSIENLPPAIIGPFKCEYFLSSGQGATNNTASSCPLQLTRLAELIDDHLNAK